MQTVQGYRLKSQNLAWSSYYSFFSKERIGESTKIYNFKTYTQHPRAI